MYPVEFVEYDPYLRKLSPREWELRRSKELAHAARVSHQRRKSLLRSSIKHRVRQGSLSFLTGLPRACMLDPFLRLALDVPDSDKDLLHNCE